MGDKLHSFSFKDGFKRARKNNRYTQKTFADEFNISIETVKNWEQGRNIPEIKTLEKLCDFFQCDLDYLFNNIECKTHDVQFIQDCTGLSEAAINRIISNNGDTPDQDFLNSFILSKQFLEIQNNMNWIKNNCHNISHYYKIFERLKSAINQTTNKKQFDSLNDDLYQYANKLEHNGNQILLLIYQCNLSFGNFLNKIKEGWTEDIILTLKSLEAHMPGLEDSKDNP